MMGETVKQGRGHFCVTEHAEPFPEGQVAELVQNDQVAPAQLVGGPALAAVARLGIEVIDQIHDVVAACPGAVADAGPGDGHAQMRLAAARTRLSASGSAQSLNGAPFLSAPGLRLRIGT